MAPGESDTGSVNPRRRAQRPLAAAAKSSNPRFPEERDNACGDSLTLCL